MSRNDLKLIMLLVILAFLKISCSNSYRGASKTTTKRGTYTTPRTTKSSEKRRAVTRYAKKFVGSKYVYGGKTPKGFDCSGFTRYVYDKFDVRLSASSSLQSKEGKKVSTKYAKAGDLVFFSKNKGRVGKVNHVALVVSNDRKGLFVIHSTSSKGVIVQNISGNSYWEPRLLYIRSVL